MKQTNFALLAGVTSFQMYQIARISGFHDQQLQILIEHILIELPEPIKNLKKLLETMQTSQNKSHAKKLYLFFAAVGVTPFVAKK